MRIALAQINPTVGDLKRNLELHLEGIARAVEGGCGLVVFPELSVPGYPPKDLLLKRVFLEDQLAAVEKLAGACLTVDALVGFVAMNERPTGRPILNAVGLLRGGKVASVHYKALLPFYDVFDESRYFERAPGESLARVIEFGGKRAAVTICEDLWNDPKLIRRPLYHENPADIVAGLKPDFVLNMSASPFVAGKPAFRDKLFGGHAMRMGGPLIVVNQVGGNDELVFDGNSAVYDAQGVAVARCKGFEEDFQIVDLDGISNLRSQSSEVQTELDSIHSALVLGLRDYVRKTGFKTVVLGLSGGIDSALTAALAVEALGAKQVVGIAMPSRFSSTHSVGDARELASNLGIEFHIVPIGDVHDAYELTLDPVFRLAHGPQSPASADLADQNIQARIRGATLMAFSNRFNHLLLTTGNKSELATGYCTLYGDMCGGLAVISDVPKMTVWALSRRINEKAGRVVIPVSSIEKVPSAELRPNQTDQDSLPAYELLDAILHRYIEEELGAAEIIAQGYDAAVVQRTIRMVDRSEYKRRQAAPGLKVTSRAFGFGRRMPIAQNYLERGV